MTRRAGGHILGVEQQAAATRGITRNVQQAAGGTQRVSSNINRVSAAVEAAGTLREEVEQFLAAVRAA